MVKKNLGQYFTTAEVLLQSIYDFIQNNPAVILEPSAGRGDLVVYLSDRGAAAEFDTFEIDETIPLLEGVPVPTYCDFLTHEIKKKYTTIVANPPYVRTKKGNLYIDFIEKCVGLLEPRGELVFIVPADFLKLTSAAPLLCDMMSRGTFTHIFHPCDENLFEGAAIDVIVFRYVLDETIDKKVMFNGVPMYIINNNGMICFSATAVVDAAPKFADYFDIFVGLVSGKEEVFKNAALGNIDVLNGENKVEKYIYYDDIGGAPAAAVEYLRAHKTMLAARKIRAFNETNWFQWGAPRNIDAMRRAAGRECIYIYNLTRRERVAFCGRAGYFGGGLIMLLPKRVEIDIVAVVEYLNSRDFRANFLFSGRFKIGHRQISNSLFPVAAAAAAAAAAAL